MQAVQSSIPLDAKPVGSIDAVKRQSERGKSSNTRLNTKVNTVKTKCATQKRNANFDFVGVAG